MPKTESSSRRRLLACILLQKRRALDIHIYNAHPHRHCPNGSPLAPIPATRFPHNKYFLFDANSNPQPLLSTAFRYEDFVEVIPK